MTEAVGNTSCVCVCVLESEANITFKSNFCFVEFICPMRKKVREDARDGRFGLAKSLHEQEQQVWGKIQGVHV